MLVTVQETVAMTSKRVGLPPCVVGADGGVSGVGTEGRRVVVRLE